MSSLRKDRIDDLWCQPLHGAGYQLFPVHRLSKVPRDRGWQARLYAEHELAAWLQDGGNVGVLLAGDDLVLDIDPRHGGNESFTRLQADLEIDLGKAPAVLSGREDGGKHIYLKKPSDLRVRKAIDGYIGIDVKAKGGFVLAPGSRHPATGKAYRIDPSAAPLEEVVMAPQVLLDRIRRLPVPARAMYGGGELSPEQLELLLSALDPEEYREYVAWFRVAAASHDATNGEGLDVWLTWAARDEQYGTEADEGSNTSTWMSLTAGKAGGITYLHLLSEVARAGRLDLVLQIEPTFVVNRWHKTAPDFSLSRNPIDSSAFNLKGGKP